jgi:hypothetical protein
MTSDDLRRPANESHAMAAVQPGRNHRVGGAAESRRYFHREDWYLVPFSLMWGGFAIFGEAAACGILGNHKGIRCTPLLPAMGLWGRFLPAAWLKKRTHYIVTNRRAIVVQNAWQRKVASCYLDSLPALIKDGGPNGTGTLRFAQAPPRWSRSPGRATWKARDLGEIPKFVDIEDVDLVYRLVSDLREKAAPKANLSN